MKRTTIHALITASIMGLLVFGFASPALADSPLYGTCTAIPYNANVGDNVNWQVQGVYGGNGAYSYAWSGTDSLTGNGQTVYKTYTYPGTKSATVTITSGGQVFTTTCSTNVSSASGYYYNNGYYNNYPYNYSGTLTASCYALPSNPNINDQVTWYGTATGGSGNYTYSWSGTDGLYGNSATVYRTYSTLGTKTATLSVYSNGQTVTQTCTTNVGGYYSGNSYNNYYGNSYGDYPTDYNNCYYNGSYYNCNNYNYNNSYYNGYNGYNNGYYNGTTYNNPPINQTSYTYPTTYTYPSTYTGTAGTPVAGVFLNQVPSTGKDFNMKMALFLIGLFGWSVFAAFLIQKKRSSLAMANNAGGGSSNGGTSSVSARIEEFKKANLVKKGLLK